MLSNTGDSSASVVMPFPAEHNSQLPVHLDIWNSTGDSESESYVTTDGQSVQSVLK
jgi:hypothetical protein